MHNISLGVNIPSTCSGGTRIIMNTNDAKPVWVTLLGGGATEPWPPRLPQPRFPRPRGAARPRLEGPSSAAADEERGHSTPLFALVIDANGLGGTWSWDEGRDQ